MRRNFLFALMLFSLVFFFDLSLYSFGAFNIVNGSNRADLKWSEINTDNVKIVYHQGLRETALRAAAVADSTYHTLSKAFDIKPSKQVLIYISDQDDIMNGATVMDYYIFIWVDSNDFVKYFTGNQKWLEKVIPHEMTHWFVFHSLKDWLSSFFPITMTTFPTNLHEGYAMYFSGETWGLNRGDKFLRTYTFSDFDTELDYYWLGNFMYANGFSFVKYLAEFYEEVKLIDLLKYRDDYKLYDFNDAFKEVYKKPFKEIFEEWSRYIKTWYYGEAYLQKLSHADNYSRDLSINAVTEFETNVNISDIVIKTDKIISSVKLSEDQLYQNLIFGTLNVDSLKVDKFHIEHHQTLDNANHFINFDLSPNGTYAVSNRYARHKHGRLAPMLTIYDIENKKKIRIGEGAFPAINDEGIVYYQYKTSSENMILKRHLSGEIEVFLALKHDNQIVDLKLSPDGKYLAATIFDNDRDFLVAILDTQKSSQTMMSELLVKELLQLNSMPHDLLWSDNENLAIMMENENNFKLELYLYHVESEEFKFFDTPPYNIYPRLLVEYEEGLRAISLNEINRNKKVIGKVNLIEKEDFNNQISINQTHYYNRWIHREPTHKIADTIIPYEYLTESKYSALKNIRFRQGLVFPTGKSAFGMAIFSEPLGKHIFMAAGHYKFDHNDPYWIVQYTNNNFKPSINVIALNSDWYAGIINDKLVRNNLSMYSVSATFPIYPRYTSFSNLYYELGMSYYDFKLLGSSKKYSDRFENDDLVIGNVSLNYFYNLPWVNNMYHPVRSFKGEVSFDISDESLGMKRNYQQFKAYTDFSFAPLLNIANKSILQTIGIANRTSYRLAKKDPLLQFLPGVDDSEYIFIAGKPIFSRMYLRGFNEVLWGREMFSTQSDLRLKLVDDIDFSINLGGSLISSTYLGGSLWYDYTRLSSLLNQIHEHEDFREGTTSFGNQKYKEYIALGWEIRSAWQLLGVPTVIKFGQAYKPDRKMKFKDKLELYYILEIPFVLF